VKILKIFLMSSFLILISGCGNLEEGEASFSDETVTAIILDTLTVVMNEDTSAGTYISKVTILKEGSAPINEMKLYGISANYFNIDVNGTITLSSFAQLNASIKNIYNLEAIATNTHERSNRAKVTINIDNFNIPRLEMFNGSVDENATAGTVVGNINLVDIGTSPVDGITLNGYRASDFNVGSNGEITLSSSANLDDDVKGLYTLDAVAVNSSGNSIASEVMIVVNDVNSTVNAVIMPLVLIAINFNDYSIVDSDLNWNEKIFGGLYGQINHYYKEVSNGRFLLQEANETKSTINDGIIQVTLAKNHPGNNLMSRTDLADALNLADPFIDFSLYDKNSNGNIEVDELQIMFIVAGGETAYGDAESSSVWAHASGLSSRFSSDNEPAPLVDGVRVMDYFANGKYSRFGERQGNHSATIGVIVHELGHAIFGLPDLYDRNQLSAGIGYFGLMGSGSWTAKNSALPGETPPHMCAWSKLKVQWVDAQVVSINSSSLELRASHSSSSNIIKVETDDPNEYFLVENRSPRGYDAGLFRLNGIDFAGGVAIWHIDETQANEQNDDASHKLVDLEEANDAGLDLSPYNNGTRTNLFYGGNSISFDNLTSPNSKKYDGVATNIGVNNISVVGSEPENYIMYIDIEK